MCKIRNFLNKICKEFEGDEYDIHRHAQQRSIGDQLEGILVDEILKKGGKEKLKVSPSKSKKSIEDVLIELGHKFYIDIKTKDEDSSFSMPNLISIPRL